MKNELEFTRKERRKTFGGGGEEGREQNELICGYIKIKFGDALKYINILAAYHLGSVFIPHYARPISFLLL